MKKKKKAKYVLLVWHLVPEDVFYFLIPLEEIDTKHRLWLRRCHGNFINAADTVFNGKYTQKQIDEALMMVGELVSDPDAEWLKNDEGYFECQAKQYKMSIEDFAELYGAWYKYKLSIAKPASIPKAKLVQSGFIL